MSYRILYRDIDLADEERAAISKYFPNATDSRMDIREGDVVIGRYSVLPFYREQERDIKRAGARMLLTYKHHQLVADMEWVHLLQHFTPRTWMRVHDLPMDAKGSFIVKGITNSRKHRWSTHMFARTRADVGAVVARLLDDTMIGQQDIVVREYHPLHTYMIGLGGLPITEEYRFFMAGKRVLASGFYWASHALDVASICGCGHTETSHQAAGTRCTFFGPRFGCGYEPAACSCVRFKPEQGLGPCVDDVPLNWLDTVTSRLDAVPLYVMDVARTVNGEWIVVELNDFQMSGLGCCNPDTLYANLANHLQGEP